MPKNQPLIDDLLTLGGSLFGNLAEARHELRAQAKTHVDTLARRLDLVSREEFDAAFAMLSKARALQDDVRERLERIEAKLNLRSSRADAPCPEAPPKSRSKQNSAAALELRKLKLSSANKKKKPTKRPLPSVKHGKSRAKRT